MIEPSMTEQLFGMEARMAHGSASNGIDGKPMPLTKDQHIAYETYPGSAYMVTGVVKSDASDGCLPYATQDGARGQISIFRDTKWWPLQMPEMGRVPLDPYAGKSPEEQARQIEAEFEVWDKARFAVPISDREVWGRGGRLAAWMASERRAQTQKGTAK